MDLLDDDQRRRLEEYHPEAAVWIHDLPALVDFYSARWNLAIGPTFRPGGDASWAAPVARSDGTKAVLKVGFPDPEAIAAEAALRNYDAHGAVTVYEHEADHHVWLLELCEPGTMAAEVSPDDADDAAAAVLPLLWQASGAGFATAPRLTEVVARRATMVRDRADRIGDPLLQEGADLLADLAASAQRDQLLHGDFNQRNVLLSERGWLAIDPRPMIGDPAYELAMWLATRIVESADPVLRATRLARRVDVPAPPVLQWLAAQTIQLCSWLRHSGESGDLLAYEQAARRLLSAI